MAKLKTPEQVKAEEEHRIEEQKKWGVPDYTDAKAYPKNNEDLAPFQWKWEFLRRQPEYRKEWETAQKKQSKKSFFSNLKDPRVSSKKLLNSYAKPHGACVIKSFGEGITKKIDHEKGSPEYLAAMALQAVKSEAITNPYSVQITFDLTETITNQIAYASDYVTSEKKKFDKFMENWRREIAIATNPEAISSWEYQPVDKKTVTPRSANKSLKNAPESLPILLRMLDAFNSGRTYGEIAEIIGADVAETTIAHRLKRAKAIAYGKVAAS